MPKGTGAGAGGSHEKDSVPHRLYDLLDTLVAMRIDFGHNREGKAAGFALGPKKYEAYAICWTSHPRHQANHWHDRSAAFPLAPFIAAVYMLYEATRVATVPSP